jgi:hypothetical protein
MCSPMSRLTFSSPDDELGIDSSTDEYGGKLLHELQYPDGITIRERVAVWVDRGYHRTACCALMAVVIVALSIGLIVALANREVVLPPLEGFTAPPVAVPPPPPVNANMTFRSQSN